MTRVQETYATPGPVRLDVRVPAGEVALEAVDGGETALELQPLRDDEVSRKAVETARVELRERHEGGQEVIVDVSDETSGWRLFSRGAEVSLRIRCPHGTAVELETSSADVEARGLFGAVDATTAAGDLVWERIERDARVRVASGDVQIAHIGGACRINSASGDVVLRTVAGSGDVNTASGDVEIHEAGSSLSVNTASGDVVVHRPRG